MPKFSAKSSFTLASGGNVVVVADVTVTEVVVNVVAVPVVRLVALVLVSLCVVEVAVPEVVVWVEVVVLHVRHSASHAMRTNLAVKAWA